MSPGCRRAILTGDTDFIALRSPPGENTEQEENQRQGLGGPWTFQGRVDEEDSVDSTLEEPEKQEVN